MYRDAARRLAEDGDVLRVASECGDVLLYPLEGGDLIHVGVVAPGLFGVLAAERGEGEETQTPETVVEGDQDDTLPGEPGARRVRPGAAAEHEGAAMNPDHDRKPCPRRGPGRPPHIEKQTIFRRGRRHSGRVRRH